MKGSLENVTTIQRQLFSINLLHKGSKFIGLGKDSLNFDFSIEGMI